MGLVCQNVVCVLTVASADDVNWVVNCYFVSQMGDYQHKGNSSMSHEHKCNVNSYRLGGITLMSLQNAQLWDVWKCMLRTVSVCLSVCRLWVSCRGAEYRSWSLSLLQLLIRSQEDIDCF